MPKKTKAPPIDGLSPKDLAKLRSACRQVWHRSYPRKLAIKRYTDAEGYPFCGKCGKRAPRIHIDHIIPCGDILSSGYFVRLICPSSQLMALCKECHAAKTKAERGAIK